MRKSMYAAMLGIAMLVLMASSMLGPIAYSVQPVAAVGSHGDAGSKAAKVFVKLANQTVARILGLAYRNNITLPDNLTKRAKTALRMLDEAYRMADERPGEAISLAMKALRTFKPVSEYVLGKLGINISIDREALIKAIDMHLRFIDEAKARLVEAAEKHNVSVPEDVWRDLNRAECILRDIKSGLEKGNITTAQAAKRLGEAKLILAKALHESSRHVSRIAFKMRSMGMVIQRLGMAVVALDKAVNVTITAVEHNRTRAAIAILDKAIDAVDRTLNASSRVEAFMEEHNIDNETAEMLKTMISMLTEVRAHMVSAKTSLEKGDKAKAIEELEAARQKLSDLIEYLKDHLREFRNELAEMLHHCKSMHDRLEKAAKKHLVRGSKLIIRGSLS